MQRKKFARGHHDALPGLTTPGVHIGQNGLAAKFVSRPFARGKLALFAAGSLVYVTNTISELAQHKLLGNSGDYTLSRTDRERAEH